MAEAKEKKKAPKGDAAAAPAADAKPAKGEKREKKGGDRREPAKKAAPVKEEGPRPKLEVENYKPRLLETYRSAVAPALQKRFSYKSPMQVPKLVKITLNVGLGEATQNPKLLDAAAEEIARMTGQKPIIQKSKKAIANFRLRENQRIGVTVTLRRQRMWEFFDRLVNVALPRVRDFRGVSPRAFDGRGNYTLGVREQIIFPEIDYDRVEKIRGLNVSIVTTAKTDEEGLALLTGLGMPFRT
ncbi:MAG TPA: 50S ribosomal protein L5 [Myxococcota bacterium]|nr:50S ribosomal protein L5 [Myxococcota bacterium]